MQLLYKTILLNILLIFSFFNLYAQENSTEAMDSGEDYIALYENEQYSKALSVIKDELLKYYKSRPENQKLVTDFIYIEKGDEWEDLYDKYRQRKVKTYFIEENNNISLLHLYAARCYNNTNDFNKALNNYYTSFRFKELEPGSDDKIFYEIAQLYKKNFLNHAYLRSLERAYSLNTLNYDYSLELGKAFISAGNIKKAIYHLQRYFDSGVEINDPRLYLLLGNQYEKTGKYLETERCYRKYLEQRNDDAYVNFALGHLAYKRTGNYILALDCLQKSLQFLPEDEIFRRSKAEEYQGDIYMSNREYEKAVNAYMQTRQYQDSLQEKINSYNDNIKKITQEIGKILHSAEKELLYDKYTEYMSLKDQKVELEYQLDELMYDFKKLNTGRIRWNIAELYARLENPEKAVEFYKEAIIYDYRPNKARELIKKLQLKIARGY